MPQRVAANDVVPRTYPGKRRIDNDKLLYSLRMLGSKGIADHVADIVGHKVGLVDLERIEHAGDVFGLGFLVVTACGSRRQSHPAQVRHDDEMIAYEVGGKRRPHITGFAEAVQQNDSRTGATDTHIDLRS